MKKEVEVSQVIGAKDEFVNKELRKGKVLIPNLLELGIAVSVKDGDLSQKIGECIEAGDEYEVAYAKAVSKLDKDLPYGLKVDKIGDSPTWEMKKYGRRMKIHSVKREK